MLKLQEWSAVVVPISSVCSLMVFFAAEQSFFVSLVFFVSPCEKKQKHSEAWISMYCNLPFLCTSTKEVHGPSVKNLCNFGSSIQWCAQDLKTLADHWDLVHLHLWVWACGLSLNINTRKLLIIGVESF